MTAILIVCTANICRSPMTQGIMGKLVLEQGLDNTISVDSAGTHAHNAGRRPYKRAQQVAESHGVKISKYKARMVAADDFKQFDYIIAMDQDNLRNLRAICPEECKDKLSLILDFAPQSGLKTVHDPYFGNLSGFTPCKTFIRGRLTWGSIFGYHSCPKWVIG